MSLPIAGVEERLQIEYVRWDSLQAHPRNIRLGDTDAIVDSVRMNDVYRPIIVSDDGTILAGHHLWYALGELGREMVPIVRRPVDPFGPEGLRILLVDNRSADRGKYDEGGLLALLREIDDQYGLEGTAYETDDIEDLARQIESSANAPFITADTPYAHPRGTLADDPAQAYVALPYSQTDRDAVLSRLREYQREEKLPSLSHALADLLSVELHDA